MNYYTEGGTFAVSKDGELLVYRNSVALPLEMSDETVFEMILANVAFSINVAERFSDLLLRVSDHRMSIKELRGMLP